MDYPKNKDPHSELKLCNCLESTFFSPILEEELYVENPQDLVHLRKAHDKNIHCFFKF